MSSMNRSMAARVGRASRFCSSDVSVALSRNFSAYPIALEFPLLLSRIVASRVAKSGSSRNLAVAASRVLRS